jgi:phenol/toluene 2-monooxygenase (NADH) P2/A2
MTEMEPRVRMVGIDLQDTDEARSIIDALDQDNPDAVIRRMPGMVKVQGPGKLLLLRSTVEELLGREWDTQDLQLSLISLSGNVSSWDEDEIVLEWEH